MSGLLLDTHALLWWQADDRRLSPAARAAIADQDRRVFVSAATAYEIALKAGRGRLELPDPPDRWFRRRMRDNGFMVLAISSAHALAAGGLSLAHGDPFDRLLIAQAQAEGLAVVTADPAFARYDVETLW